MRILKRLCIFIVVLILFFVISATLAIKFYGKGMLEQTLTKSLKRKVTISSADYQFPFGIKAEDMVIAGLFKAKNVSAQIEPSSIRPLITQSLKKRSVRVVLSQLFVDDGYGYYLNKGNENLNFQVSDVELSAQNLIFPLEPAQTFFQLTGRLIKGGAPLSGSRVQGSGWINVGKGDMDATVELIKSDGKAGLTARLRSTNNDMTVNGNIEINSLVQKAIGGDESLNNAIFGALSSMGVEIGAQFSFATKMNDFQIRNISFSGNVAAQSLLDGS